MFAPLGGRFIGGGFTDGLMVGGFEGGFVVGGLDECIIGGGFEEGLMVGGLDEGIIGGGFDGGLILLGIPLEAGDGPGGLGSPGGGPFEVSVSLCSIS